MKEIPLHDYQITTKEFIKQHPFCAIYLDMGMGKACDDDTIVPTPDGYKRLGDVEVGDQLFGRDGNPVNVTAVFHHENKNAYRVTLSDGRNYICCDEHLTPYIEDGVLKCKPLADLLNDYDVHPYHIPMNEAVEYPEQVHEISPYDLGLFLRTKKIKDERMDYALAEMGIWINDMSIPQAYLLDSIANRKELLSGLFGEENTFYTDDSCLTHDILLLCHSLGIYAEKGGHLSNDVHFTYEITKTNAKVESVTIKNISGVTPRNMTCFTVDAADHLFLINDYIVTHNTLTTLCALMDIRPSGHILVIAPKTIARATWTDEINDWQIPVRTKSLLVNENGKDLSRKKRLELYEEMYNTEPSMYFINREKLSDLVKYVTENKKPWPFQTVVIDEMQSFKSQKSGRFKALRKVRKQITRLIGLSGTPAPNGLLDLWSQIWLLDMGERLGKTETFYKNTYFDVTQYYDGRPVDWAPKKQMPQLSFEQWLLPAYHMTTDQYNALPIEQKNGISWYYNDYLSKPQSAEDVIYDRISDICISKKNSDSLKLPEKIIQDVYVTMDKTEKALYKRLKDTSVLEFSDDTSTIAANAAVLSAKLIQMASGTLYTDDMTEVNGCRVFKEIHSKKIEMCQYIIDNTNSPVLIAYHFKSDAKRLAERIDGAVLFDKTPEMIHDWNDGKIKVMLVQPASAGHGLNLQKGPGHTLIWFTIPWSLEEYEQMNKRLHRQGQKENVTIYRLFTKGTFDTKVARSIRDKAFTQNSLLTAIEETMNEE